MKALVIGAAGDVGRGIVAAMAARGWSVGAAGRSAESLADVAATTPGGPVTPVVGSVADRHAALALVRAGRDALGGLDAVVVSVNGPKRTGALLDWAAGDIAAALDANVFSHLHALFAALEVMGPDGVFIGIGGGMADFIVPTQGVTAMSQAALRNMYRCAARENPHRLIRELQVAAMVNGRSTRAIADESWLAAEKIGEHACAMIERPAEFAGPVIRLTTKDPIGVPPAPLAKA